MKNALLLQLLCLKCFHVSINFLKETIIKILNGFAPTEKYTYSYLQVLCNTHYYFARVWRTYPQGYKKLWYSRVKPHGIHV